MDIQEISDPNRRSFIPVAPSSHFPIQNLPFGVFQPDAQAPRCGVALGDQVVDLSVLERERLLPELSDEPLFAQGSLNAFAALGREALRAVRGRLSRLLDADTATLRDNSTLRDEVFVPQADVRMLCPLQVGDYTDFYSSREHATNVGTMFRGADNALQPNWLHLPVAYHGRSSSIIPTDVDIIRPHGQTMPPGADRPQFGPSKALDFELEMGFFVGSGIDLGDTIAPANAEQHIFGLVLVNDWSARDIQRWEYVPLGPFLGKSFATSISPWVVTLDALEPFRCQGPAQDPSPLPYLCSEGPAAFDVQLEVNLKPHEREQATTICRSNFKYLYWSMRQQLAHHASNGCNVQPGDLLASGTISGPTPESFGSMLELAWKGERPLDLGEGVKRAMLQDGDRLSMSGCAEQDGLRVGFGRVSSTILPARQ